MLNVFKYFPVKPTLVLPVSLFSLKILPAPNDAVHAETVEKRT